MKKLLLLLLILPFVGCSSDDDNDTPTVYEQRLMGELSGYWYWKTDPSYVNGSYTYQIHRYNFLNGEQKIKMAFMGGGSSSFTELDVMPYTMTQPDIINIHGTNDSIIIEGDTLIKLYDANMWKTFKRNL